MAEDNEVIDHVDAAPVGVGPRLQAARESAGLTLAQMSDRTKIPTRMLALIEAGDFGALPARTYATGFTRSYARALGLDEKAYLAALRSELGLDHPAAPRVIQTFEPGDPARIPTARFAWLAAVAALVVLAAGLVVWRTWFTPAVTLPPLVPEQAAPAVVPSASVLVPLPAATPAPAQVAAAAPAVVPASAVAVPGAAPAQPARAPASRPAAPAPAAPAAHVADAGAPAPASTVQP